MLGLGASGPVFLVLCVLTRVALGALKATPDHKVVCSVHVGFNNPSRHKFDTHLASAGRSALCSLACVLRSLLHLVPLAACSAIALAVSPPVSFFPFSCMSVGCMVFVVLSPSPRVCRVLFCLIRFGALVELARLLLLDLTAQMDCKPASAMTFLCLCKGLCQGYCHTWDKFVQLR